MKTRILIRGFAAALAAITLTACAGAAPAAGQPGFDEAPRVMPLSLANLNPHTRAEAEKLLTWLRMGSQVVCVAYPEGRRGVDAGRAYRACRDTALETSVVLIGSPQLYAAYKGRAPDRLILAQGR